MNVDHQNIEIRKQTDDIMDRISEIIEDFGTIKKFNCDTDHRILVL